MIASHPARVHLVNNLLARFKSGRPQVRMPRNIPGDRRKPLRTGIPVRVKSAPGVSVVGILFRSVIKPSSIQPDDECRRSGKKPRSE